MYPVRLGYNTATRRIRSLLTNGHQSEALVTSVFTIEKTLYRVMRALIISAGFSSNQTTLLMKMVEGMSKLKEVWECFDPAGQKLPAFVAPTTLQVIAEAQRKRNALVHGTQVFSKKVCEEEARRVLTALNDLRDTFARRYRYDGWSKIKGRKRNILHADGRISVRMALKK